MRNRRLTEDFGIRTADYPSAAIVFAIAVNTLAIFGSAWLALGPLLGFIQRPYAWIVATQIATPPLAALAVWLFPDWYSLFRGVAGRFLVLQNETAVWLFGVWFPTIFTITIYYEYLSIARMGPSIPLACLVGAGLLFVAGVRDRDLWAKGIGRVDLVIAIVLCFAYGYATVLQLNCVLDRSTADIYKPMVLSKRSETGRRYLGIGPWGPEQRAATVRVSFEVFRAVQPGDSVCVVARKGALGMAWYTIETCPWNSGPILLESGGRL